MPEEIQSNKSQKITPSPKSSKGLVRDISSEEPLDDELKVKKRLLFVLVALGIIIVSLAFLYSSSQREKKARQEHEQALKKQKEIIQKIAEEPTATSSEALVDIPEIIEIPEPAAPKVLITDTPTGWLNVRSGPGTNYLKVTLVYPDEVYPLLTESENWYKIELEDGKEGWIYSQYAEKQ